MTTLHSRVPQILGIKYPIIQGTMSWMTDARLVAAVSNVGGVGMLGPHAGQFANPASEQEAIEHMRDEIRKVKTLTDKPFAVPVVISGNPSLVSDMADMLINEKVPVVLINEVNEYDVDETLYQRFKQAGIKIICRPIDPTPENAKEAQRLGADIFVATGFDEGGSVPTKTIGTFSITQQIAQAVDIPVLAAGGITEINGARAVFALGGEGVYIGTGFLATHESRMVDKVKQMLVNYSAQDLLLFRTYPAFYRSLPTKLAYEMVEKSEAGASRDEIMGMMRGAGGMRTAMLEGDLDNGYISVGNGITYIKEIRSVKAFIDDLMQNFQHQ